MLSGIFPWEGRAGLVLMGWLGWWCREEGEAGDAGTRLSMEQGGSMLTASCPLSQLSKCDWHLVCHGSHYPQVHLARQGAGACGDPHQVSTRNTVVMVAITALQSQAGVQERGLQRLVTNPSQVQSLQLGTLHIAARISQVAASLGASEEVMEEEESSWRSPKLHHRF